MLVLIAGIITPVYAATFFTDFNSGVPPEFSGFTTTESVQGYSGLGPAGNTFSGDFLRNPTVVPIEITSLTLTGLTPHSAVDIKFLLAIIDSWDGTDCRPDVSPDIFNVRVDGNLVFSESFENSNCGVQSYSPPAGVELARHANLGFNPGPASHLDSAYNMGADPTFQNFLHSSDMLKIEWYSSGAGWQGGTDESWAIDNVEINLLGVESDTPVGGQLLSIDMTALFLAGVMANTVWMVPTLGGIAGAVVALFIIRRNHN